MKKVIGITGGIASGKSTVVDYLIKKGYIVIDADKISRKITSENDIALEEIKKEFGSDFFISNKLDRKKLGELIFNDNVSREKLNNICHPIIRNIIIDKIREVKEGIIFLDVPLLYEAHFDDLCDYVVVVYTKYDTQLKRLSLRDNISLEYAKSKINSQLNIEDKVKMADYVIDNNGTKEELIKNIEQLLERI
ncbi:MAG: dephospho-CoA kinase [Anaeroplasmataceae bacterium]